MLLKPRALAAAAAAAVPPAFATRLGVACLHATGPLFGGKPRLKTIPVSQRLPRSSGGGQQAQLLALTPEALKKKVDERNAAEAAEPRRGRQPPVDTETTSYLRDLFEPKRHPLAEILRRHREFACPEMLNNPAGTLYATCLFDMTSSRAGKFLAPFAKVIRLPHALPEAVARRHSVIAFCSSPELAAQLKSLGAVDAGGADLITKLETGAYVQENFDYVVCHPDFWPTLLKARKLLKEAMPAAKSPQVTEDLEAALLLFQEGVPAKLKQSGDLPDRAHCKLPFGRLDWPDYHLETNLAAAVTSLLAEKPRKASSSSADGFIMSLTVTCPPSDEVFLADLKPFLTAAAADAASAARGGAANASTAAEAED